MKKKQRNVLIRIIVSAAVLATALGIRYCSFPYSEYVSIALLLISYLTIGFDILWRAVRNILHGQVFDENFLMSLATVGAVAVGEYPEAVFVMLFYQVGELFQSLAVGKSRKSIASLMQIRPDYANVMRDGMSKRVSPSEVAVGETIEINPGEKIPLDGIIIDGSTGIDTVALTGESVPREAAVGDEVISGCVNLTGVIHVRVTKEFEQSTVLKILELVQNTAESKAKSENFITKFARIYTPAVVAAAVLLAVLPPLILGMSDGELWREWVYRALTFLVISCPCALVISVPLSFFGGIGCMSRHGILVKGSSYIETLAKCKTVVFDKTGTLTHGNFLVTACEPVGITESKLIELGALAESNSSHPIAAALREKYGKEHDKSRISGIEELAGFGVHAVIDGKDVYAGNDRLMKKIGVSTPADAHAGTVVHIAVGTGYRGFITVSDTLKSDSADAVRGLRKCGVREVVMLTGDKRDVADSTANRLGIDTVYSQLLPADKVDRVERLLSIKNDGTLAFVGDGINDAPVLARADVGIAMGALGSDAAIEAADVVLMDDKPSKIPTAMEIARYTLKIVKQNIVFVLIVKAVILAFGAVGLAGMWAAVFADVGVSVIAILNSLRTLRHK